VSEGTAVRLPRPARTSASVAITGSKGGVGKSNLALNLAVALARWGRRVLLVDGDLGRANLDVLLGLAPERTVEQLMRGAAALEELLLRGPAGIRILPGASGAPELARFDPLARTRLVDALTEGETLADHVLIDAGAGLGENALALQVAASRVLVVTTPEPTSIVDAYATLKVLWSADPDKPADLVVNACASDDEARQAYAQVAKTARSFLGREPGWLGAVHRDPLLPEAVRRQRALIELYPMSAAGRCYEQLALRLTRNEATSIHGSIPWQHLVPAEGGLPH